MILNLLNRGGGTKIYGTELGTWYIYSSRNDTNPQGRPTIDNSYALLALSSNGVVLLTWRPNATPNTDTYPCSETASKQPLCCLVWCGSAIMQQFGRQIPRGSRSSSSAHLHTKRPPPTHPTTHRLPVHPPNTPAAMYVLHLYSNTYSSRVVVFPRRT